MNAVVETVINSLKEVLGSTVKLVPALLGALIIIFLTSYAAQAARNLADRIGTKALKSRSLQLLLKKTAFITAWVLGILLAATIAFPGLGLGDIIATLGLGSVAIGFAFQDIFKNFLAGILLLVQEPFRIGDQIIVTDYEGTVEEINIRTTRIRTYLGEQVLIPNSNIFTSAVQVRTALDYRRTDLGVGVDYNTSLEEASHLLQESISLVEGVLEHPEIEVDLVSFGDSSIDFIVRYWTNSQQKEVRRIKTKVILAIKKAFDDANISIPYPIRTFYFYNQEKFNDYLPGASVASDGAARGENNFE
ncbi:MAG: mechanosensitive ion channel family protein [Jaaginema sp. PMC 1079.18]|nr:mechanosensitive ion channel family protein [Jaaginema sp. PMC 1080.18]MEC4852084.1 mechanosensitive ion channel family protein [Jaaginema sp. PMC 1079.18]MEC4865515.1 mechanosensitive ion channel family protein [Jaaginema sp. PMC 1078.18]